MKRATINQFLQFVLLGVSLIILSAAFLANTNVLGNVITKGPGAVFAAPCGLNEGCPPAEEPQQPTVEVYGQCGGTAGLESFPSDHEVEVTKTTAPDGAVSFSNRDMGSSPRCGAQPEQPKQPEAPVQQQRQEIDQKQVSIQCNPGEKQEVRNGGIVCVTTQVQTANQNQNQNINIAQGGTANATVNIPPASPQPSPSPVVKEVVKEIIKEKEVAKVECPEGTEKRVEGDVVKCIVKVKVVQEQPKVVTVAAAKVEQLPKTGLPLAAWGLLGLAPFAFKLRNFGRKSKESMGANSMWERRQFKR